MRKLSTALMFFLILIIGLASALTRPTSSAAREFCSCTASDGSCSASGSCTKGCVATCPSNGCTVRCSGFTQFLEAEATIQMQNVNRGQLVAELARLSGKEISFSSTKPDAPFNIDARQTPLWDLLELLADNGTLLIGGEDFEKMRAARRALVSGEKISLCAHNTPVGVFVKDMANLTGLSLRVVGGNPRTAVDVKLQDVTLKEILDEVSARTGVQIINDDEDPDGR